MNKIKNKLIKQMKTLNTYDESFEILINNTAKILFDLKNAEKKFEETGGQYVVKHTNKNGSSNFVKNPFYLCIEKLRDDSITHLRELGLSPQGYKKLKTEKENVKADSFEEILKNI